MTPLGCGAEADVTILPAPDLVSRVLPGIRVTSRTAEEAAIFAEVRTTPENEI